MPSCRFEDLIITNDWCFMYFKFLIAETYSYFIYVKRRDNKKHNEISLYELRYRHFILYSKVNVIITRIKNILIIIGTRYN